MWLRNGERLSPREVRRTRNNRHGKGSEFEAQCSLAKYLEENHPDILFCASAGGARTSISEAKRMKASGYSIEMKKEKGGVVSKHQKQWKESLIRKGYKATIAKGFEAAVKILEDYLNPPKNEVL